MELVLCLSKVVLYLGKAHLIFQSETHKWMRGIAIPATQMIGVQRTARIHQTDCCLFRL